MYMYTQLNITGYYTCTCTLHLFPPSHILTCLPLEQVLSLISRHLGYRCEDVCGVHRCPLDAVPVVYLTVTSLLFGIGIKGIIITLNDLTMNIHTSYTYVNTCINMDLHIHVALQRTCNVPCTTVDQTWTCKWQRRKDSQTKKLKYIERTPTI